MNVFNKECWNEIMEAITANPFRTLLTAFGVFWGIFILVILLAAGKGLENGIKRGFEGVATNTMFMWTRVPSKSYKGMVKGRSFNFKTADVVAIKQQVPGLRYVSPRNQLGGHNETNNVVRGLKTGAFSVYGDYPEIGNQKPLRVTKGRFLNAGDIKERRKVAVIGEAVVAGLFEKDEDIIGAYIKIQGVHFMVVGVYKVRSSNGDGEEDIKEIYTPFTTFSQAFNYGDNVAWMAITAKDETTITSLKKDIIDLMKVRHTIHPKDNRAIGNFDLYKELKKINGLFIALEGVAYFVGILILLSGIIGISNIMLIVVKERTKEIGIRRAIGAGPGVIRAQILLEAIVLTIISGMVGIIMATFVLYGVNLMLDSVNDNTMMFANPSVDLGVVCIALVILVISGLLAGLIPAQTAIKVKPVVALRSD